ncbi:MAG: 16S rRNA (adenine(1518)-N(6)/adenine(1519)-N(6))-dimethyltransferase, partial [Clostridia bacterium]|nr:16S rRNA (adenine(1518)-N(6)/adenine(1519)-N(6))-dimethyltransferase [Clostridia bacterium]
MSLKDILVSQDFHFNKRFGQNFISDRNLLDAIVQDAGVGPEDTVLEIGAGAGTLTAALAERAKEVVAYE